MFRLTAPIVTSIMAASPLSAEVAETRENGFVTRSEAIVEASRKETWLALISPSRWWVSSHTWSGDAGNLQLTPQAGGCFCETIPEVDEPDRFTLEGSVEHMRVVQADPENALRMVGALGPLQSEPVVGVLTIALSEVEGGTRIVWEYNVGGSMRYDVPQISQAIDGVMREQVGSLAGMLGAVSISEGTAEARDEQDGNAQNEPDGAAASIDPDDVFNANPVDAVILDENDDPIADDGADPDADISAVDEAFGDLSDD